MTGAPDALPAARRYQEILAEVAVAADDLRDRDRRRADGLARRLVDLEAAMVRAGERAALTRIGVELAWEAALDALWTESWMTLRTKPGPAAAPAPPDPAPSDPAPLDPAPLDPAPLDTEVAERGAALLAAVRRPRFGLRRR